MTSDIHLASFIGGITYGAVFCNTGLPWAERIAHGIIDGAIWALAVGSVALIAWAIRKYVLHTNRT